VHGAGDAQGGRSRVLGLSGRTHAAPTQRRCVLATERPVSLSGNSAFVARCRLPHAPTGRFCDGMRAVAFSMDSVVSCRSLSSRNRAVAAVGERQKPARSARSIL
jgi:hypothetical protein